MAGQDMTQTEIESSNQQINKDLQKAFDHTEQTQPKKKSHKKKPPRERNAGQDKAKEISDRIYGSQVAKQQWAGLEALKDDIDYGPDKRARKKHNHSKVKLLSKKDINK